MGAAMLMGRGVDFGGFWWENSGAATLLQVGGSGEDVPPLTMSLEVALAPLC